MTTDCGPVATVACFFQGYSIVSAKDYFDLLTNLYERPTSIKRPLTGTPRVAARA